LFFLLENIVKHIKIKLYFVLELIYNKENTKKKRRTSMAKEIPYKIYLEENEMPTQWYNVRADMKKKPAPILNPATLQPVTLDELSHIFCTELAKSFATLPTV
jgi:threonyl-tRNA synthetase